MMLVLSVDTTTSSGSVALIENTTVLSEMCSDSQLTFSERLLPSIHLILELQGKKIQDVKAFALAVGPGSFTGIRIGVSTVKSLARASGRPVAPVSSLEALALKLLKQGGRLCCPFMDAKKGEVYTALFEKQSGNFKEIIPQGAYSPDEFLSRLPSNRIVTFIGSGLPVYREKIFDYLKDKARFSTRSLFIAQEVGLLGNMILKENKGIQSWEVEPLYFRKSQAEESHSKG